MKLRDLLEDIRKEQLKTAVAVQKLSDSLEFYTERTEDLEEDMKVVRRHVDLVAGALKVISVLGAGAGAIIGLLKALKGL